MPSIHFYNLKHLSQSFWPWIGQWFEQRYLENQRFYLHTDSKEAAEQLDERLWTFEDTSFLPHELQQEASPLFAPICIGYQSPPPLHPEILVNFACNVPAFFSQFKEVVEFVLPDPISQPLARDRYRQYRAEGLEIITHQIKKTV